MGGYPGDNLTPRDIVRFTEAYGQFIKQRSGRERPMVVIGRDARVSGKIVSSIVASTLNAMGVDVSDAGLSTTPTVEVTVTRLEADGGIIITASHNPAEWNALKLLDEKGEFLSATDGEKILKASETGAEYSTYDRIGQTCEVDDALEGHLKEIIALDVLDLDAIAERGFRIAVDGINSSGAIAIPGLLKELGVAEIKVINDEPTGLFAHNPEPLKENVTELCNTVKEGGYDLGIVVDPDVDRLAFVDERGEMFGEEYTLVAVADYVLSLRSGNTVSNMSSSRALRDVTEKRGGEHFASAVGEVNVVAAMKEHNAVIGGEGNGGVIYPRLHYGRDALVGTALFLSHLAREGCTASELRSRYPNYYMEKQKLALQESMDVDAILEEVKNKHQDQRLNTLDGVRIDFEEEWVHLRKSNTEPIIRIYAESTSQEKAIQLTDRFKRIIKEMIS